MKAFHFKVLISLLTGIVYMNFVVAQHETTAPINKKEFSHVQLSKNDENMVLKVADSISKIRVAHMDSNDDMPGSKGIAETPERVPGLTLNNNEPVVYVLNTPGHEFVIRLSRLEKIKK